MGHFLLFSYISRNCHFVTHFDIPKKLGRKSLIVTNFFLTSKQYVKIKLMQNVTTLWSIFLVKAKYWYPHITLLKYVKSQRSYGFLITKELIFGFQILDLKDHFSTSLTLMCFTFKKNNMQTKKPVNCFL